MVKDDILNDDKVDTVPTIDDFVEEESRNKRKRSHNIFLEDDYDDLMDYDYDDEPSSSVSGGFNKSWVDDGISDVDDLLDDDDF